MEAAIALAAQPSARVTIAYRGSGFRRGKAKNIAEVRRLVEKQLEFPTGGFRAATWDAQADVEYTFYGLGLVALLHQPEP